MVIPKAHAGCDNVVLTWRKIKKQLKILWWAMENNSGLSDLYRFLAQALKYPQEPWFGLLFLNRFFEICAQFPELSDDLARCRAMFSGEFDKALGRLQQEYTRLFISAYPSVIAPPYGSVYFGDGGLFSEKTEEVRLCYLKKGQTLASTDYPPDYLCYELEFMAILAATDPKGLDEFIDQFFRPWFLLFEDRVYKNTQNPYIILNLKLLDYLSK